MIFYLLHARSPEILSLGTNGNNDQVAERDCATWNLGNPDGACGGSLPAWPCEVQVLTVHM